ncbi:MAG: glutamine amidotransferase-related protein [Thermoleophilia bacterium]
MSTTHGAASSARRPRVVVLQHHARVPLGALAPPLEQGAELIVLRLHEEPEEGRDRVARFVADGDYHAVIALGGPVGVYEADRYPFLRDSLRLARDALTREVPILGICLGAQLLSEALGSPVFPGAHRDLGPQVGFFPLALTAEGMSDPATTIYAPPTPTLFWHRDTHDLPHGAVLLASTGLYPMAAFRWGRWAYGLQFHLETTLEWLPTWVAQSPLAAESGVDREHLLRRCAELDGAIRSRAAAMAELLLENARSYAGSGAGGSRSASDAGEPASDTGGGSDSAS